MIYSWKLQPLAKKNVHTFSIFDYLKAGKWVSEWSAAKRKDSQGKGINEGHFLKSKQKHQPVIFTVGLFAGDLADTERAESRKISK